MKWDSFWGEHLAKWFEYQMILVSTREFSWNIIEILSFNTEDTLNYNLSCLLFVCIIECDICVLNRNAANPSLKSKILILMTCEYLVFPNFEVVNWDFFASCINYVHNEQQTAIM